MWQDRGDPPRSDKSACGAENDEMHGDSVGGEGEGLSWLVREKVCGDGRNLVFSGWAEGM